MESPSDHTKESANTELLKERLEQLARTHGPWRENVGLAQTVSTAGSIRVAEERRVAAILQASSDALGTPLGASRVLDLGPGDGRFSVEFALQGAEVVAIEGRLGNVEKVRFLKDALDLDRLEVVHADVRDLRRETFGSFDLVLCLGVLYHLDGAAAVGLVHQVAEMTTRAAVIDTHVGFRPSQAVTSQGRTYRGERVREFDPKAPADEQERLGYSSLGNAESLWLTRPSLLNLISDAGFTSVGELRVPRSTMAGDRITLLAFRGAPAPVMSARDGATVEPAHWGERERSDRHPGQRWRGRIKRGLAPLAPRSLKNWVRRRRGGPAR